MERTLIYDADCGFCTRSAQWLAKTGRVNLQAWQWIQDLGELGLTEEMVTTAAYWADGVRPLPAGEAAIAHALICRGSVWSLAGRFILLPGIRTCAGAVYKVVARNRHSMPGGTNACRLPR